MGSKVDWTKWRRKFVEGSDELTLKELSQEQGAPAYQTLRHRSSKESWDEQRNRFRNNLGTLIGTVPEAQQVAQQLAKIIDTAELVTQHARAAREVRDLGMDAIKLIKPESLKPKEALDMIRWAIEAERLLEGLATERRELDLTKLTEAELERLANGLD